MITNTKFFKKYKEEIAFGLAFGLVSGLAFGLAFGLVSGLVSGLAIGLVFGLAIGLVFGLAFGLAFGLVFGLAFGLAFGLVVILINWSMTFPFLTQFKEITLVVLGILILIEIFYWLDNEKPKGKLTTSFVLKKKFEATCEVLLGLSGIAQIYVLIREGIKYLTTEVWSGILRWIGYIGLGVIGLGIVVSLVYLWVQLNKLKYKK